MEALAKLRFARIAPRKARLVADLVRGMGVDEAVEVLSFTRKKSAPMISKLIQSAVSNAEVSNPGVDVDELFIQRIFVDEGPTLRRYRPRAHGRATRVRKRTSHITVVLSAAEA